MNKMRYASKSFFFMHHVNTYEDDGHLVVDVCAYTDNRMLQFFNMDNLKELSELHRLPDNFESQMSKLWRFVLPIGSEKV